MKSDTLIGIIGSVLLVGIIIGVFVYEYNNVEEQSAEEMALEAFARSDYSHMEARGDIDGDGTPNFQDTDMDGDGVHDTVDAEIAVTFNLTNDFGPALAGEIGSHQAEAFQGASAIDVQITVAPTSPVGVLPVAEQFSASLMVNGVEVVGGSLTLSAPGEAGNIVLAVSADATTFGGSYAGTLTITY